MNQLGFMLTATGALIIGGYYTYGLLTYLFSLSFIPFPVRVAIPLVVAGILLMLASMFWEAAKRSRREQIEGARDRITEYPVEREFVAQQLIGSND